MNSANRQTLFAILVALLLAAALAWAGSQGGAELAGVPLFALAVALTFIIQWIVFIPSYLGRTEHYFDLTGSLTYFSITLLALWFSPRDGRSFLLAVAITIWALRLGSFLYQRVRNAGEDRRFKEIKQSFGRFLTTWTLQGLWVSITAGAAWTAMLSMGSVQLGWPAAVGAAIWVIGFCFEAIADFQKSQFRDLPENIEKFIQTGLWAWSRHPNYFGEVTLWLGVALIAFPALSNWQYVTLISPVFVFLLITRISGVNLLEQSADEKWGGDPDYEAYKDRTPEFFPRLPKP